MYSIILSFLFLISIIYFFCYSPIVIRVCLIIFSLIVSIYSGSLGLLYYNYVLLIPILRGLCVLFYYISCICFDRDDDSMRLLLVFFFFFHFVLFASLDIFRLNISLMSDDITYWYNNDISWCLLTIGYLCICLVIVINLCRNLFLPMSSFFSY